MLTINIAERWELHNFSELFTTLESIHYKATPPSAAGYQRLFYFERTFSSELILDYRGGDLTSQLDAVNTRRLEFYRQISTENERLYVNEIEYASPGFTDILGLGKLAEILPSIIGSFVRYYDERHSRRDAKVRAELETQRLSLDVETQRATLHGLKIQNAKKIMELRRDLDDEQIEILTALLIRDQDKISDLVSTGQITSAEMKSED